MKLLRIVIVMVVFLGICIPQAFGATCTKEDVRKAVLYAADLLKAKGKAALPELEKYRFCGEEGYVFICDMDTVVLFHPVYKKLVGVNQTSIQDAKGKYFGAELKAKAQKPGEGWVAYAWPNPTTKVVENKCTYLKTTTMDGKKVMVCAGVYGISESDCK